MLRVYFWGWSVFFWTEQGRRGTWDLCFLAAFILSSAAGLLGQVFLFLYVLLALTFKMRIVITNFLFNHLYMFRWKALCNGLLILMFCFCHLPVCWSAYSNRRTRATLNFFFSSSACSKLRVRMMLVNWWLGNLLLSSAWYFLWGLHLY